jgi:hypothetical protein
MSYSWDLPTVSTYLDEYYSKYAAALGALLATHQGTDDPKTTGDMHAVPGTRWDDINGGQDKCKALNKAGSGWYIVHDIDVDYGGLLPRAGTSTYPMTGKLHLAGQGLALDADHDSELVLSTDDQVGMKLDGVEVLRIGEVVATKKLLDLKGLLRLAQPEGITTGAAGSVYGKFPMDIDGAGTIKYVELKDAP